MKVQPVLEKKHDVKQNFKVPTWDDLDKAEANTSLSFGFGLVDSEAYISKDDPEDDVVKTIQETKNATDVSFSKSDQPWLRRMVFGGAHRARRKTDLRRLFALKNPRLCLNLARLR